jgi:hypothetical protein
MRVRNFYVRGYTGYYLPDKTFVPDRAVSFGPPRIMGGMELEFLQRTCGEPHGAQRILLVKAIAEVDGRLVFQIRDPKNEAVWTSTTHRDGKV